MLVDKACDYVRKLVRERSIGPHDVLSEEALAEDLDMSRTPVRAALVHLQDAGLLIKLPGRGWGVRPLTQRDIEQIFQMKTALEGLAVRLAAERISPEEGSRLIQLVEGMERSLKDDDLDVWLQKDGAFHTLILAVAGNERLQKVVRELNDQWYRLRASYVAMPGCLEQASRQHRDMAEAIVAQDADLAEQAALRHLEYIHAATVRLMDTFLRLVGGQQL